LSEFELEHYLKTKRKRPWQNYYTPELERIVTDMLEDDFRLWTSV